jgi:hypothetical protein
MNSVKPKVPTKGAGTLLRDLSKKRREDMRPSKELVDILKSPAKEDANKKSATPNREVEI